MKNSIYHFFSSDTSKVLQTLGKEVLIEDYKKMVLIRNLELRLESCYQQGKIGGFMHSYIGQEAIQTACIRVMGEDNWYTTTYRCHALALLLKVSPKDIFAELFGKVTGNALGRGGSMHLYSNKMLGGFAIVGGHTPIAAGAAFSLAYKNIKDKVSVCFLGEGSVPQGAFHESLNLVSLWNLPCIFVIENNQWGMGTPAKKAVSAHPIAEKMGPAYNIKDYTLDGMDYFNLYAGFSQIFEETKKTQRPALVEVITERFKGHSISDPGFYRSKEEVEKIKKRDPIHLFKDKLIENKLFSEEEAKQIEKDQIELIKKAMDEAEADPDPDPINLGEDVFAPEDERIFGV